MGTPTHEELISKGFTKIDDPFYQYELDLSDKSELGDDEEMKLQLLIGDSPLNPGLYHLNCGGMGFLTINLESLDEAMNWAKAITGFEPNY